MSKQIREENKQRFLAMSHQQRSAELKRLKLLYHDLINSPPEDYTRCNRGLTKAITLKHIDFLKPIVREENIRIDIELKKQSDLRKLDVSMFFIEIAKEILSDDLFNEINKKAYEAFDAEKELLLKANQL